MTREEWTEKATPDFFDHPRSGVPGQDVWGFVRLQRKDGQFVVWPIVVPQGTPFSPDHPLVQAAVMACQDFE